jgi:multidrug resistance efflux pump
MKNNLLNMIHKPKIVISVTVIVALAIFVGVNGYIGRAPKVVLPSDISVSASSSVDSYADSVDLAFPKIGRVSAVNVQVGDFVKKGDVIASLEASDAQGAIKQAKGALELARAQYASLDVQYTNAKRQQDVLVANAYRTLLSSGLVAVATNKDSNDIYVIDNNQVPTITGTYTCDKEGSYEIKPYASGTESGYSFEIKDVDGKYGGVAVATFYTPQAFGTCGLFVQFPLGYHSIDMKWIVEIPNKRSISYAVNKNAYDLAVATRDQVLKQYEANLGQNGSSAANMAQAAIDSAEGIYETALGAYQNNLIVAPMDGVVTFVDSHLKVGQSVLANKSVITISKK